MGSTFYSEVTLIEQKTCVEAQTAPQQKKRYNKSNATLALRTKKWMGNEKMLKSALMKKYSKSRTEWNWSVLDSIIVLAYLYRDVFIV